MRPSLKSLNNDGIESRSDTDRDPTGDAHVLKHERMNVLDSSSGSVATLRANCGQTMFWNRYWPTDLSAWVPAKSPTSGTSRLSCSIVLSTLKLSSLAR